MATTDARNTEAREAATAENLEELTGGSGDYRTDDGWYRIHREKGLLGGEWWLVTTEKHPIYGRSTDGQYRTLKAAREALAWDRQYIAKEHAADLVAHAASVAEKAAEKARLDRTVKILTGNA